MVLHREAPAAVPEVARAEVSTLRQRLGKVGAVVQTRVRRIGLHFRACWPQPDLGRRVQQALARFAQEVRQAQGAAGLVAVTGLPREAPARPHGRPCLPGSGVGAGGRKTAAWRVGSRSSGLFAQPFAGSGRLPPQRLGWPELLRHAVRNPG